MKWNVENFTNLHEKKNEDANVIKEYQWANAVAMEEPYVCSLRPA